jgi:hypothetical protein
MAAPAARTTVVLFASTWSLLFGLCHTVFSTLWPGALTWGAKALASLPVALALIQLLGDYAVWGPRGRPTGGVEGSAATRTWLDQREGVARRQHAGGSDVVWARLAPDKDWAAHEATTGRAIGLCRQGVAVRHDVPDEPTPPLVPAWLWRWAMPERIDTFRQERQLKYGSGKERTGAY